MTWSVTVGPFGAQTRSRLREALFGATLARTFVSG